MNSDKACGPAGVPQCRPPAAPASRASDSTQSQSLLSPVSHSTDTPFFLIKGAGERPRELLIWEFPGSMNFPWATARSGHVACGSELK